MERYAEISDRVFEVFAEITPLVEGASLDEAFLDVTGSQRLLGEPAAIARHIKDEIRARTGLTASVGVSTCRFVAKIASDMEKPDGLVVIQEGEVQKRLAPLPVSNLWGVGPQTNQRLATLGIHKVADLIAWPPEELHRQLGETGPALRELALGIDPSPVVPDVAEKSVSHEITFERDVSSRDTLTLELLRLSDLVAARLRRRGLAGRVVHLKLRYDDFTTLTRQVTLPSPARTGRVLHQAARRLLLDKTDAGRRPVRLIGVGVAGLEPAESRQAALFDPLGEDANKTEQAERAVDRIRERMGSDAIGRSSLHENRPSRS
jgi:nucleotidyltransferase/DNA polymerase involved in DNA repair